MERRRRRWWTITVTAVSSLIIGAALVSGAFQLAVRAVPGYREQLSQRLGELFGRPVAIGDLRLTWRGYYPSLDLDRVTLLPTAAAPEPLAADRLRLAFSLPRLLLGERLPTRIDVIGAEFAASRDAQGAIQVRGFEHGAAADPDAALRQLQALAQLRLTRCVLTWTDEPLKLPEYRFEIAQADLDQSAGHFEFDLDLGLPAMLGQNLSLHADLDGELLQPQSWSGPWAAYLRGVGDGPLLRAALAPGVKLAIARARLRLKGELQRGRVPEVAADWESGAVTAERDGLAYGLASTAASAQIALDPRGWSADLQHLDLRGAGGGWPDVRASIRFAGIDGGFDLDASADFIRLADAAPWLHLLRGVPAELAALHDADGEIARLVLHWQRKDGADQYRVSAALAGLGLPAAGRSAGFARLSGELSADEKGGHFTLRDVPLRLELPRAFAAPVDFDALSGDLAWQRAGEDWRVKMPDLQWRLAGSAGKGVVALVLPADGSPQLDLSAHFSASDATRFKPFMPLHWGAGLRDWLERGVNAARVPEGELTIKGPLADFPFNQTGNGQFRLDLDVADARIAFHPDWPPLERLGAQLRFQGNSLFIVADGAAMLGARVGRVDARFDDFHDARLVVDGEVDGDLSRLYRLIDASPLVHTLGTLVHHTRAAGAAQVNLHLDIPLRAAADTAASGTITLKDASLEYQALQEPIRGIAGRISFGPEGVSGDSLSGQFYEVPVQARLVAVSPHLSRLLAQFRYAPRSDGSGVSALVPSFILPQLAGESAWNAELDVGSEADSALRLTTDLQGTALKFPPPLAKQAEERVPLALGFSGDEKVPLRIGVNLQDRFAADLQFASVRGGALALASALLRVGAGPAVAGEPGVVVVGHAAELDLAAWSAALAALGEGDRVAAVKRAELTIDRPIVGGQRLLPLRVKYLPQAGGWRVELHGEGGEGQVTWRSGSGGNLSAQLQHLALNYRSAEDAPANQPPRPPLDPGALPLFDLDCASLQVSGLDFGHLHLVTERVPGGQKLAQLKLDGGALQLDGGGQWWRRDGGSGASLSFHLDSERTADVLKALDYAPNITAKSSKFDVDLLWAPNPRGLELAQARGHLSLEIENGSLKAIEPGAGRVLGLLNFYALPRRLTLNFRDVLGQGLGFDKITGSFDLGDGDAVTSDLLIAGPSLRMETRGRVGLVARDYDQHVTVYPDVSAGITLGALLVGGPALGALALIAQQVLDKPLDQVTQLTYHVTGTWDNPEIKRGDDVPADESKMKRRAKEAAKP